MKRSTAALVSLGGMIGAVFFDNAFVEIALLGISAVSGYEAITPNDDVPAVI